MDHDNAFQSPYDQQGGVAFRSMIVLIVAAVVLLLVARWRQPRMPDEWAGRPLPPLEAAGWLNADKPLTEDDLRGKVVLLDFWLTTCGPCVASMPDLASLNQRFRDRGLMVVGLTPESESDVDLDRFMKARPYVDWPNGYGARATFDQMGIYGTPTYVVYDRNGLSTWGGHSLAEAEDAIVAALATSVTAAEVE